MSEFAPPAPEKFENLTELRHEAGHMLPTAEQAERLRPGEADPALAVAKARASVAETQTAAPQANPLAALQDDEDQTDNRPQAINQELRDITYRREMRHLRDKESPAERALSHVIHQPVVRAVSAATGSTISRPSGLLGGGLVAFVGSAAYLFITKYAGFRYNYFIVLLLLAAGFVLGLTLEVVVHLATASRRQAS